MDQQTSIDGVIMTPMNSVQQSKAFLILRPMAIYFFLGLGAILMLFPFYWMISGSFKTYQEIIANPIVWVPANISLVNYQEALQVAPFVTYFQNTVIVAISNTVLTLITTILAAFAFSQFTFKGRDTVFALLLTTLMIPSELLIITNYSTVVQLGRWNRELAARFAFLPEGASRIIGIDTYGALVIPFIASIFYIYLLRQFFNQIPRQLYLAAKVDGCSDWKYMWTIMVPNSINALITIGLFNFISSWNAYIWPLLVTNNINMRVLSIGLRYFTGEAGSDYHLLMAAGTFVVLPLLVLYLFTRRFIIAGVARSGIKG
jgi:multiple sugar transport system permease protein